ncbi:MAG: hypothetical protein RLY49_480 [Candidatus Parcubacteria bacterium]|jgi:hypothetical protein
MDDISNYEKLRNDSQKYYSSIGRIRSPALKEFISFKSEGFNHIIYKNSNNQREQNFQMLRFKLLPLAKKLIEISTTYQEFEETIQGFVVKERKKKVRKSKVVRYWGIIAIINGRKIKVILRKIGDNGDIHFWSIIPAWSTNKFRDIKLFSTMKGNPKED